ncbi:MAG: hypothetical protein SPLM_09060 [Spiroplasma phoeniceum]
MKNKKDRTEAIKEISEIIESMTEKEFIEFYALMRDVFGKGKKSKN